MQYAIVIRCDHDTPSGYEFLYGTDADTKEEMDAYCKGLDPKGKCMKVVALPFDENDPANLDYTIEPEPEPVKWDPATIEALKRIAQSCYR